MRRSSVLLATLLTIFGVASCSKDEATSKAPATSAANATSDAKLEKVPILPGYKYYVGGPTLQQDAYGRYRITSFNGEIQNPPSRGMIFGVKTEGDKLEYRVWGNGVLLGLHRGVMRQDLFWQDYAESYRMGKLVARENSVHNDEEKASVMTAQDIDPETGEVIRTKSFKLSYTPPKLETGDPEVDNFFDEDEDEDEDEEEEDDAGTAAPAAPPAAAPAAAPPAAK